MMGDLLYRPLPFLKPMQSLKTAEFHSEMEPFHPAKMRSVSTSTPILTRDMLSDRSTKMTRSMSTGHVNDSGFDESFDDSFCDQTICVDTPSTLCKLEKRTPVFNFNSVTKCIRDRSLDDSFGPCPFSVRVNRYYETPGATFFSPQKTSQIEPESKRCRKQSMNIPSFNLDLETEVSQDSCLASSIDTSSLAEKFDSVMQSFSSSSTDRVIGRKMGLEHVDIVGELSDRNISCSIILRYLGPRDLCSMCEVSRKWESVCNGDPVSRKRKRSITDKIVSGKENIGKKSPPRPLRCLTDSQKTLAPLQPIGKQPTPASIRVDLFKKAAEDLKNEEKLRKCPKCSKVAKVLPVQDRGQCLNSECSFDFCSKCFYPYHGSKPCTPVAAKKPKTDSIGSKKSKKNLKRL